MRAALGVGLAALAMLAVPAVQAAPWLQPRGDAAATGFQPEEGPAWKDVALDVDLPDGNFSIASPLILEDRILVAEVLARPTSVSDDPSTSPARVHAVDRATGEVTTLGEVEHTPGVSWSLPRIAADGDTLYLAYSRAIHAIPLTDAGHEWTWTFEPQTPVSERTGRVTVHCSWLRVEGGNLTVPCTEYDRVQASGAGAEVEYTPGRVLVAHLDETTGTAAWTWQRPPGPGEAPRELEGPAADRSFTRGLAVAESRVVVETVDSVGDRWVTAAGPAGLGGDQGARRAQPSLWALDAGTGDLVWNWSGPPQEIVCTEPDHPVGGDCVRDDGSIPGSVVTDGEAVYAKAQGVRKFNLGTGEELWHEPIGEEDLDPDAGYGTSLALADGQIYTTSAQTVYRMDAEEPTDGWSRNPGLPPERGFVVPSPVVTPSTLYLAAGMTTSGPLFALDRDDGDVRWRAEDVSPGRISVGEGVLTYVQHDWEGEPFATPGSLSLVVLGRTEASPTPAAEVASAYPAPGEPVEVDLSTSETGAQGPVTRYKAIWGDGNATGWQSDPVLTHRYDEPGNVTARFVVGNEANQTNSTTRTFHVGQQAPTEPNLVEEAFQRENQDLTFGVLGIVVAVAGGAVGVARRRRKRTRLQDELDTLEQGFEESRDRPAECEAFLETRRARARSLVLDGVLTEEQGTIVQDRADELRRELRTRAVEEEFGFLPHALVVKARKMLEDGEVTELEAEAFLSALEDVELIGDAQRAKVRQRIEDWFARDSGGGRE